MILLLLFDLKVWQIFSLFFRNGEDALSFFEDGSPHNLPLCNRLCFLFLSTICSTLICLLISYLSARAHYEGSIRNILVIKFQFRIFQTNGTDFSRNFYPFSTFRNFQPIFASSNSYHFTGIGPWIRLSVQDQRSTVRLFLKLNQGY